jgi:hypothetical protein
MTSQRCSYAPFGYLVIDNCETRVKKSIESGVYEKIKGRAKTSTGPVGRA